jgi:hypothetical protein
MTYIVKNDMREKKHALKIKQINNLSDEINKMKGGCKQ